MLAAARAIVVGRCLTKLLLEASQMGFGFAYLLIDSLDVIISVNTAAAVSDQHAWTSRITAVIFA